MNQNRIMHSESSETFHQPPPTFGSQVWGVVSRMTGKGSRLSRLRPLLAHYIFRVDVVSSVHHHLWDETSLVLRKGIAKYLGNGFRVLDLGTGQAALLAIYCSKLGNAEILAVDVNEDFLENAVKIAAANDASGIHFRRSDWFSHVDGSFDLIWANIPYIPTQIGMSRSHRDCPRDVWDGGNDGFDHGRRILREVGTYLAPGGRLLLGVNTAYVPRRITLRR